MSYKKQPKSDPRDPKKQSASKGDGKENGNGDSGSGGRSPNSQKNPKVFSRGALSWILLGGLAVALLLMFYNGPKRPEYITWGEFRNYVEMDAFEGSVIIKDSDITGEIKPDTPGVAEDLPDNRLVAVRINPAIQNLFVVQLDALDQLYEIKSSNNLLFHMLISWGPIILIAFLIYFFVFRAMRNAAGGPGGMLGNFGRSKHKMLNKEHSTITLDDVAGIEEAKDEVGEIIEFLKNPKKFQRLGGRVPRGVLLIGAPGCGKTLLAKAVAGEADVPFFSISGSDFVEMFVGVGASRVRDLFKQAKESAPCIIFLDEIDAVGRRRGSGFSSGGHDEREQTLNAILVEMDGFDSSDQVILMAATNRADVLDPALLRPGRFDRQITVPLPDIKGRMEILNVHAKKVKMGPDVDMEKLARGTPMFSGADLEAIINEAAIAATLANKDFVEQNDMEEARDKVKWGRARKSHKIEEKEKEVIAYHEAGHAVVMYYDDNSEPLHKVTIIPRGQALGATFMLPEKDRHIVSKKQLLAMMRVAFGGRIAEQMCTGDMYNGTAGDIRQATGIARAMVTEYGMSKKVGFQQFAGDADRQPWEQPEKQYSDDTAKLIDQEVKALIDQTYSQTEKLLQEHRAQLEDLAQALLKYETLSRQEVDIIMAGKKLDKATVSDLLQAEKDKVKAEQTQPTSTPEADLDNEPGNAMPSPA